jgi:hypothetical protein
VVRWETFRDESYYDMWCVRPVGERRFGHSFHLINGDEAKGLCEFLETQAAEIDRLRALLHPDEMITEDYEAIYGWGGQG